MRIVLRNRNVAPVSNCDVTSRNNLSNHAFTRKYDIFIGFIDVEEERHLLNCTRLQDTK
jgi:hypothetical protein